MVFQFMEYIKLSLMELFSEWLWMVFAVCKMGITFKLQSQYSESMCTYVFAHYVVVILGDHRPNISTPTTAMKSYIQASQSPVAMYHRIGKKKTKGPNK